jgi:spermidine/putrescine transport system permease protein
MGWRRILLPTYLMLALFYMFLPVLVVVAFSFNDNQGRFNVIWQGFTLRHWLHPFADQRILQALGMSLLIALIAAAAATVLGTLIALALSRYNFRGRAATNVLLFFPMATPEVVMGSSLLGLFVSLRVGTGLGTILLAHVLFILSYAVVTVRARVSGLDRHLEEAAMDLYANEWQTFRRVTLPMIMPGVFAAFLLGFALSVDDFIVTNFTSGTIQTFPLFVWGAARRGIPPQVNVMGTALFILTVTLMLLFLRYQNRAARRL